MTNQIQATAVSLYRGDALTLPFCALSENGEPIDLTGAIVYFSTKIKEEDVAAILAKTSADVDEILILDQTDEDTKGCGEVYIVGVDTLNHPVRTYRYDIRAKLADDSSITIRAPSPFEVLSPVTVIP